MEAQHIATHRNIATSQWLRFTPTSHASTASTFFHERYCNILQFDAICERLRKALSQLFLCVSFISFTVDHRRRKYSRKGSKCPEHPEMLCNCYMLLFVYVFQVKYVVRPECMVLLAKRNGILAFCVVSFCDPIQGFQIFQVNQIGTAEPWCCAAATAAGTMLVCLRCHCV